MEKIQIRRRFDPRVLFAHEAKNNTIRLTVEAAVTASVDLVEAYLAEANLDGANLAGAHLDRTNLAGAHLDGANLGSLNVPVVTHIDAAILRAIETPGCALDMHSWHTCATTHCRAGWAIALAGAAGAGLEDQLGPSAAASLIYAASRPTQRVPKFSVANAEALSDLRACAAADPLPAEDA